MSIESEFKERFNRRSLDCPEDHVSPIILTPSGFWKLKIEIAQKILVL